MTGQPLPGIFQVGWEGLQPGARTPSRRSRWTRSSAIDTLTCGITRSVAPPSGCCGNAPYTFNRRTFSYTSRKRLTPRGYYTIYAYDSNSLCVTQKVVATGTPNQRTFTYTPCDLSTSLPTSATDADHGITHAYADDSIGRPTLIAESGGGIARHKKITYDDASLSRLEQTDLNSTGDQSVGIWTVYDQLGRVGLSYDYYGDWSVKTLYYTPQGSGNSYRAVSNPYVTAAQTTDGWTITKFDTSGRVSTVQHFAGAALPAPRGSNGSNTGTASNSYASNYATSTDEAGVSRTSYTDGLGRLTQVMENGLSLPSGAGTPPCNASSGGVATTCYYYDVLDDLISVTPPSGCGVNAAYTRNGRTFSYSSLKRLTSATNPESGTTSYGYDANGNLSTRTAGGIARHPPTMNWTS